MKTFGLTVYRFFLRLTMLVYMMLMYAAEKLGKKTRYPLNGKNVILITGTFYSDHWLSTHLVPMALAKNCQKVIMVATSEVPQMENVEAIYPPPLLKKTIGTVPSRLLMFAWVAIKTRPEVVAGFHILINGLVVALLGKIIGARSIYICGGGPREVLGGGYKTENRIFNRIHHPDERIERYLLKAVDKFYLVITMGKTAVHYFQENGVKTRFEIVPGGFDGAVFAPSSSVPEYDLVLIGRLSEVKRVDLLLEAVKELKSTYPYISAVIVGDGPIRSALETLADELGVKENVHFAGWQSHVDQWLKKSKVFTLTSDSEGLSQAMIQAMLCGLPVVVSDVGDLGDMVVDGENGFLVQERTAKAFAEKISHLLGDESYYAQASESARRVSEKLEVANVSKVWEQIL